MACQYTEGFQPTAFDDQPREISHDSIMLIMLLLFSGSPLSWPLSLPPLPADPLISNVAPEQCLWYMSLAGVDRANPASKNQVEQLLAEADVQAFTKQLISKLKAAISASLALDPARKGWGKQVHS